MVWFVNVAFDSESVLIALWAGFVLVMLFLLGSAVGSFLNVCIVRLPQGRSLIRPASCCGHCQTPIRLRDNIPLLSYWLLRGRCRACGAPFSMRYFWIELLTGVLFVLIYHLEIGRNIHHFKVWSWYENNYEYVLMRIFDPQPWLLFLVHALLGCFVIVVTMSAWESQCVPRSVTLLGVVLGLLAAVLCPWPWPNSATLAFGQPPERNGREGLYPWPIWQPLPAWLPPGSRQLGLATGLAGIVAGAVLMVLVRLAFNAGVGTRRMGDSEISLLMIAGGFLGWQPVVAAALLGLGPGLGVAVWQGVVRRRPRVEFVWWLALAIVAVWFGWFWLDPWLQGLFFNPTSLLWLAAAFLAALLAFAVCLRLRVVLVGRDAA